MMRSIRCLAVALGVVASGAAAQSARLGDFTVQLTVPPGHCVLEEREPADRRALELVNSLLARGGNRLLLFTADCRQLADWRAGRRETLADFAQYQTLRGDPDLPPDPRGICRELAKQGARLLSANAESVRRHLKELDSGIGMNESRFIGVLADDPDACYSGFMQRMRTEAGREVTLAWVGASTFFRRKIVYYLLYTPYAGEPSLTAALARQKANVAALRAANAK